MRSQSAPGSPSDGLTNEFEKCRLPAEARSLSETLHGSGLRLALAE